MREVGRKKRWWGGEGKGKKRKELAPFFGQLRRNFLVSIFLSSKIVFHTALKKGKV